MSKVYSLKCPNCGAAIYDENAVRCEYCGSTLSIEGRTPEGESEPSAPDYSWVCVKCGGDNPPNYRYCLKCGSAAGDNPKRARKTRSKPSPSPASAITAPEPVRVRGTHKSPFRRIGGLLSGLFPFFLVAVILIVVLYFSGGLPPVTKNFIDSALSRGLAVFGEFTGSEKGNGVANSKVRVLAGWPLKLYDAPDIGGNVVGELKPGEEMAVLEVRGDWYKVRTADGREGWVQYVIRGSRVVG